ncbi:hypothetical protein SAMN05443144_1087 [Fodinibius roseus]|uniref:Uncharacterized protein n=1 Tax=Fodinibius roseus TaxID=1194090 RepID=A0A1M5B650_9BACT|nr:hypothetical protein [Fodinibius roseus]SHF37994.1 hypothetical protein SAMN05443144_1087 [Fodinibius roseus]
MQSITRTFKTVFSDRSYQIIGGVSFGFFLLLYAVTLPAKYTAGRIGLVSLQHLSWSMGLFALAFALLLGAVIPFTVFAFRQGVKSQKSSTAGGLFVSILTPLLCCSPLLPALMGFLGGLIPLLPAGSSLAVQKFVVTWETEIYLGSLALLALALYQNANYIARSAACRMPVQTVKKSNEPDREQVVRNE